MTVDKVAEPDAPRTLVEAPGVLARIRPHRQASLRQCLAYHQQAAAWYAEVAEIDRGRHHEALFMAEQELQACKEIKAQLKTGVSGGEDRGEDR